MLEIFAVITLAKANKKNALARGRRPMLFMVMTYVFWFGLELVGAFIGIALGLDYGTYLVALGLAGMGGLISYLIAKYCKPGDYYPQQTPYPPMPGYVPQGPYGAPLYMSEPPAEPLEQPAEIEIVRDADLRGDMTGWTFILNNGEVGRLGNGASRKGTTMQRQNMLRAVSEDGRECLPMRFNVESGGQARIVFRIDRFVPEECSGISPPMYSQQAVPVPPYGMPGMPPAYGQYYPNGTNNSGNTTDQQR